MLLKITKRIRLSLSTLHFTSKSGGWIGTIWERNRQMKGIMFGLNPETSAQLEQLI